MWWKLISVIVGALTSISISLMYLVIVLNDSKKAIEVKKRKKWGRKK